MTGLQKPLFFRLQMLLLKIGREQRVAVRRALARNEIRSCDVPQSPDAAIREPRASRVAGQGDANRLG